MNKFLKLIILLLLPLFSAAQPLGTWPVRYGTGAPSGAPTAAGSRLYYDIVGTGGGQWYEWQPSTGGGCSCWINTGRGIDRISGSVAPTYTPKTGQSDFVVNADNNLFRHVGAGAWNCMTCDTSVVYTAGTGIDITGTVISNTIARLIIQDDGTSLTDPILRMNFIGDGFGVSTAFGSQTASVTLDPDLNNLANIASNGFLIRTGPGAGGITARSIIAGTGISVTNTTGAGGNPVITNTGDLSNTNEIQTLSISGQDLSLSAGGGTVTIPAGADGNGIYGGSGTVSDYVTATIAPLSELVFTDGAFKIQINSDEPRYFIGNSDEQAGVIFSPGSGLNFNVSGSNVFQLNATADAQFSAGLNDNALFKIADNKTVPTGLEYNDEYLPILTNPRSIPDVGLVKQLVSDSLGTVSSDALGVGFVNGGGTGSIPDGTVASRGDSKFYYGYDGNPNSIAWIWDDGSGFYNWAINSSDGLRVSSFDDNNGSSMDMNLSGGSGNFSAVNGTLTFNAKSNGTIYFDQQTCFLRFSNLDDNVIFEDTRGVPRGIEYAADYSPDLINNPQSFTDVATVNLLKQTLVSYTTTQRNAISSPAAGYIIYCSDCTATDSSTGVQQVWNGSTWKNAW